MDTGLLEREAPVALVDMPPLVTVEPKPELTVISLEEPEATVGILKGMTKENGEEALGQEVRRILGTSALATQAEAIAATEQEPEVELPYGMYWPSLVGAETIYMMSRARKAASRTLQSHRDGNQIIMRLMAKG
jgi:hypothetical protein